MITTAVLKEKVTAAFFATGQTIDITDISAGSKMHTFSTKKITFTVYGTVHKDSKAIEVLHILGVNTSLRSEFEKRNIEFLDYFSSCTFEKETSTVIRCAIYDGYN